LQRKARVTFSEVQPIFARLQYRMFMNDFSERTLEMAIPSRPTIAQLTELLRHLPFQIEDEHERVLLARFLI
jgi:hypothetical protein